MVFRTTLVKATKKKSAIHPYQYKDLAPWSHALDCFEHYLVRLLLCFPPGPSDPLNEDPRKLLEILPAQSCGMTVEVVSQLGNDDGAGSIDDNSPSFPFEGGTVLERSSGARIPRRKSIVANCCCCCCQELMLTNVK